ncbi:unnamed protein product [Amoebophrya sp. A120]|nr:unnamed protein product [Amoebophrya sp. A120]|eukprot:GSA120T00025632001.1
MNSASMMNAVHHFALCKYYVTFKKTTFIQQHDNTFIYSNFLHSENIFYLFELHLEALRLKTLKQTKTKASEIQQNEIERAKHRRRLRPYLKIFLPSFCKFTANLFFQQR